MCRMHRSWSSNTQNALACLSFISFADGSAEAQNKAIALLTTDKKTVTAKERLGIMEETNDGFRIAEKDLEIRGEGEILGTRQSGVHLFRLANIVRDVELLQKATDEAKLLLFGNKRDAATKKLIERVRGDAKYRLAGIG